MRKMSIHLKDMQRLAGMEDLHEVSESALELLVSAMFNASRAKNMMKRWEKENEGFTAELMQAVNDVTKKMMDKYGIQVTGAVQAQRAIRTLSRQ